LKDSECKVAIMENKVYAISKQGNYYSIGDLEKGDLAIQHQADLI